MRRVDRERVFFIDFKKYYFYTISRDSLVADEAKVAKKKVVVGLAVGKAALLKMPRTVERPLAFGAGEVLDMPLLSQCINDAFLVDRSATRGAYRQMQFVQAARTVEFASSLARRRVELACAQCALKVVRMVALAFVAQHVFFNRRSFIYFNIHFTQAYFK